MPRSSRQPPPSNNQRFPALELPSGIQRHPKSITHLERTIGARWGWSDGRGDTASVSRSCVLSGISRIYTAIAHLQRATGTRWRWALERKSEMFQAGAAGQEALAVAGWGTPDAVRTSSIGAMTANPYQIQTKKRGR